MLGGFIQHDNVRQTDLDQMMAVQPSKWATSTVGGLKGGHIDGSTTVELGYEPVSEVDKELGDAFRRSTTAMTKCRPERGSARVPDVPWRGRYLENALMTVVNIKAPSHGNCIGISMNRDERHPIEQAAIDEDRKLYGSGANRK